MKNNFNMSQNSLQLQMNFDSGTNRVKRWLENGSFFIAFEHNIPDETDQISLPEKVKEITEIKAVLKETDWLLTGHAIAGNITTSNSWRVLDFAEQLELSRNETILYLSGRNLELDDYYQVLQNAVSSGYQNIVPLTGNAFPGEDSKLTGKRPFIEGIHGLKVLADQDGTTSPQFLAGTTTNPFKYTVSDILTQYHKLIKKINTGASFLVSQFGWDLHKQQELQWYLSYRNNHLPIVARVLFLTPGRVSNILKGTYPGVHISADFKSILEAEARYSVKQFEFAQWRRLQLQVTGLKALGYNGVQLCGLKTAEQVKTALRFIREAFAEFTTYEEWRKAYLGHLGRAEMAPYPHRCYLFRNLLTQAQLEETPAMNALQVESASLKERYTYKLCNKFFAKADEKYASESLLSKKLLVGCTQCSYCRLPQTHYICPESCPKGIANGACGGTQADGRCEVSKSECLHSKILRLANWQQNLDALEDHYIKPAE